MFSSKGGAGNLKKLVGKANSKDAQSADRFHALEQLRDEASEEAVVGMLRRFTFMYDKTIEDEQEKEWVHDQLVTMANHAALESDSADEKQVGRGLQREPVVEAQPLTGLDLVLNLPQSARVRRHRVPPFPQRVGDDRNFSRN